VTQLDAWDKGENLAEKPTSQYLQKKNLKIMVNPDVDDYNQTLNQRKIVRKTTTYWNQKNTKTEI